jgi:hypothetical protein
VITPAKEKIEKNMAITFLLGAGFSMEANYPSAHALNEKFLLMSKTSF